ncbi:DICT sensory domain-containing protein [Kibdelosporangium phytohabitans]|uniref:Sensor protein n=1 Tax=Kibdelosporangium phytohabitans TaxID=860235 RepID=A0A0N9I3C7_9PSEU|nr:DICT sensory domain-containing protein [Kibdelosporangium phytohabitans]ALG10555.1 sensor protein [Kibdelosporangium phytohabitans]MBE1461654.1 DICT domain-containing protein [Kibdelosporangium phytohabitans]
MDETVSATRAGLLTKRLLVIASHAVEQAALAHVGTDPMVVIAMFQRLPYFERESKVYANIAVRAAATVVGMADRTRPDLPPGVTPVLLRKNEDLTREWSVAVLSPSFGAAVIAQDLEDVDPQRTRLEAARLFHGRWGLRRDEAYAEVVRLRDALGDRLPPVVRHKIDETLASVSEPASVVVEQCTEAAFRRLVGAIDRQTEKSSAILEDTARDHGIDRDPDTGLHTPSMLASWLGPSTDTVPLGLIMLKVHPLTDPHEQHDVRAVIHTGQNIAELLRAELRPVDRAIRLTESDFLLIKPAASEDMLAASTTRIREGVSDLTSMYPFVPMTCTSTWMLTRRRPLPLDTMRSQLDIATAHLEWPPVSGTLADHILSQTDQLLPAYW